MIDWTIRRFETTSSTNDDARQAAEAGAAEGTVFWALEQTAGRGRRGRQWQSPRGNLYCSVLLRPALGPKSFAAYSFIAALAIGDMVRGVLPSATGIELKWPNDVIVNGRKISGILLESGDGYLVIGMGVNVRHFPDHPLYPTTSFAAEHIDPPPLETLLNDLLIALGNWRDTFQTSGFAPIREAWLARARTGHMLVRLPQEELTGDFAGLDSEGNLILRLPNATERRIATGDIFF